jgi:hypothetical protein
MLRALGHIPWPEGTEDRIVPSKATKSWRNAFSNYMMASENTEAACQFRRLVVFTSLLREIEVPHVHRCLVCTVVIDPAKFKFAICTACAGLPVFKNNADFSPAKAMFGGTHNRDIAIDVMRNHLQEIFRIGVDARALMKNISEIIEERVQAKKRQRNRKEGGGGGKRKKPEPSSNDGTGNSSSSSSNGGKRKRTTSSSSSRTTSTGQAVPGTSMNGSRHPSGQ